MILLPQAFRIMLPALISQLVVVLKDTSLGFIISYEETLNIGKQIIGVLGNPIQVYVVIAVLFIVVNYSLSKLAQYVQRRLARGRKTAGTPAQNPPPAALMSQAEGGGGARLTQARDRKGPARCPGGLVRVRCRGCRPTQRAISVTRDSRTTVTRI